MTVPMALRLHDVHGAEIVRLALIALAEQQVEQQNDQREGHDGEEVETDLTGDETRDLVEGQSHDIGPQAHIAEMCIRDSA